MKNALLVLGMHRSGTSALTRVLSLLGAELPKNLIPGVEGHNDLGHWESMDLMRIHDDLLASVGSNWHDVTEFPGDWHRSPSSNRFRNRILEILDRDYRDASLFVVKDPRVCRFVPFWFDLLEHFDAAPHVILPIRNPLEVASSLKRRDGFSIGMGSMLWLRHVLDAERDSRGRSRSVMTYDALLDDWGASADRIGRDLGLTWPRSPYRAAAEIEDFLSTSYRHHRSSRETLRTHSQIVGWVERTYDALIGLASEGADEDELKGRLDAIRAEVAIAERAFGPLLSDTQLTLERTRGHLGAAESVVRERDSRIEALQAELNAERERSAGLLHRQSELDAAIADREATIADRNATLADRDATLADRDAAIDHRDARIVELEGALAHRDARIIELEGALAHRDARIIELEGALAHRDALIAGLGDALAGRDGALSDRDARIAGLDATLADRDATIAGLEAGLLDERDQSSMLRRLIYETQQGITRDVAIFQRLEAIEHRGQAIESRADRVLDLLQGPPAAPPPIDRPGRRWWRHLPTPKAAAARLKPPTRRALARLGVLPRRHQGA